MPLEAIAIAISAFSLVETLWDRDRGLVADLLSSERRVLTASESLQATIGGDVYEKGPLLLLEADAAGEQDISSDS